MAATAGEDQFGDMEEMDDVQEASLFWSLKVPSSGTAEIEQPPIPNYIIHITKACFGPKVTNGSRTVVMCGSEQNEDGEMIFSPICVLKANTAENANLDLIFGEAAIFKVEGNKTCDVWLTGHLRPGFENEADFFDDNVNMQEMYGDEFDIEGADEDNKNEDDNDIDDDDDENESPVAPPQKKRKTNNGTPAKVNQSNKKSPKQKPTPTPTQNENNNNNNSNKQSKKQKQKNKQSPKQKPTATPSNEENTEKSNDTQEKQTKKQKKKNKKKMMPGGIEFKDMKEGNGAPLKKGDRVSVYYIGQLASNQSIFDKSLSGNGFTFTLGASEVIKGWDQGLIGMKGVGAKRKLWIPAKLGYGNEPQEGIPPNSKLLFTIEVKKVQ